MVIEILRIGQRLVRDDRVTTHVALVARAFGASCIYMSDVGVGIADSVHKVNEKWGGSFTVHVVENWKKTARSKKQAGYKIIHLTMYGQDVNHTSEQIMQHESILIIIGAEKVPREVYDMADYNVAVGNQPHSEISALAILLDRIGEGFSSKQSKARMRIVPQKSGKKVIDNDAENSANH